MRVVNYGGEGALWVSVSECRNDNTGMTHITHLKTHQGSGGERQREKVSKPAAIQSFNKAYPVQYVAVSTRNK